MCRHLTDQPTTLHSFWMPPSSDVKNDHFFHLDWRIRNFNLRGTLPHNATTNNRSHSLKFQDVIWVLIWILNWIPTVGPRVLQNIFNFAIFWVSGLDFSIRFFVPSLPPMMRVYSLKLTSVDIWKTLPYLSSVCNPLCH